MPYDSILADRIREALSGQKKIEEKTMFRGMCFMVNGKMCVCVNPDEMLVRVGPDEYEAALEKPGSRPMIQNGRTAKGFVFVSPEGYKGKKDFDYWINAAIAFNKEAKASKKKAKAPKKIATAPGKSISKKSILKKIGSKPGLPKKAVPKKTVTKKKK